MPAGHYDRTRIPRRGRPGFLRQILGDLDRSWMSRAVCRLLPLDEVDELFFPVNGRSHKAQRAYEQKIRRAKAICDPCPVRVDCEEYRASLQDDNGVWGGRDEIDRDPTRSHTPVGRPRLRSSQEGSSHT